MDVDVGTHDPSTAGAQMIEVRWKCVVCGLVGAGRWPVLAGKRPEGTARYPRRHDREGGRPCMGAGLPAVRVEVEIPAAERARAGYEEYREMFVEAGGGAG